MDNVDSKKEDNVLPFISVLLVTKDEQDYVEKALMSLIEQTYPKNKYEIIVVDGASVDNTLQIVNELKQKYETEIFSISVLNNSKKILASGWNIGIRAARGNYVVRIDAHAKADKDFLLNSVMTIRKVDAVCVGGKLDTKTLSGNNETISKVFSSPFGVGNSSFRVSDRAGYVDTAVYGLYKKSIFEEIGYFNENYERNQDLQMHSRIRKNGGRFYFNPEIRCEYYARNTIKKMIKQGFQNGKWNMTLMKEDMSALSVRHLIPFVFAGYLLITGIGGIWVKSLWWAGLFVIALHLALGFVFGIKSGAKGGEIFEMPVLFLLLHTAYGIGYFFAVLK